MKAVAFAPEAEAELAEALGWYRSRDPKLTTTLLDDVAQAVEQIGLLPHRFAMLKAFKPPVRRARLKRFPYALVFVDLPDRIEILAVAHAKRRPLYWLERMPTTTT